MRLQKLKKWRDAAGLTMLAALVAVTFFTGRNLSWLEPFYHIQSLFAGKGFTQVNMSWTILVLAGMLILLLVTGRVFCGWFCPFGAFLKLFDRIPNKKRPAPEPIDDANLKYFILIGFLFAAFLTGFTVFCQYCPAGAILRGAPGGGGAILTSVPIFIGVAALSIVYGGRTWCKSMCPLGATLALFSRNCPGNVKIKNPQKCTKCFLCQTNCPMDVLVAENYVMEKKEKIADGECINCYNCVAACPMKILRVV